MIYVYVCFYGGDMKEKGEKTGVNTGQYNLPAITTTKGNCTPCGPCTGRLVTPLVLIVATELVNLMRVNIMREGQKSYKIILKN